MKNAHEIVFENGFVIQKESLEFLGAIEDGKGNTIFSFRETVSNHDPIPVSAIFNELVKSKDAEDA